MRRIAALGLLLGLTAFAVRAEESTVGQYLVDGRIHVSVIHRSDGGGGEIAWRDTVSGRAGEVLFTVANGTLLLEVPPGVCVPAQLVPNLAVVFKNPPWGPPGPVVALGLSLD